MSHGQTLTHKTHHHLDLGDATTFPLIIYFVLGHRTNTKGENFGIEKKARKNPG